MTVRNDPVVQRAVETTLTALAAARGEMRAEILWTLLELAEAHGRLAACDSVLQQLAARKAAP